MKPIHPSHRRRARRTAARRACRPYSLRYTALSRNLRTSPVGRHTRIRHRRRSPAMGFTGTVSILTVCGNIRRACLCAPVPPSIVGICHAGVCVCARGHACVRACVRACACVAVHVLCVVCTHAPVCAHARVQRAACAAATAHARGWPRALVLSPLRAAAAFPAILAGVRIRRASERRAHYSYHYSY